MKKIQIRQIIYIVIFFGSSLVFSQSKLLTMNPSNQSSYPRYGVDVNGILYFTAGTYNYSNIRIWKTDGTSLGTNSIFTPNSVVPAGPFPQYSRIDAVQQFGNKVLIIASISQQNNDQELWVSDGSALGTFRLADINPGSAEPNISNLKVMTIAGQSIAFFSANNGTNGSELWKTDGTTLGTQMVMDINSGSASSYPSDFTQLPDKVMFFANNGLNGIEPWVTDGTAFGTSMIKDINPGVNSSININGTKPVTYLGNTYIAAATATNIPSLWVTDGTAVNTFNIQGGVYQYPQNFTVFQGNLFFTMNQSFTNLLYITNPLYAAVFITNGTLTGNVLNAKDLTISGNRLFLTSTYVNGECLLYQIGDGNPNVAYACKDINPNAIGDPFPNNFLSRKFYPLGNGNVAFIANDGSHGSELWYSNGSIAGTVLVKDHASESISGEYSYIKVLADDIYYVVNDASGKFDAWKSTINAINLASTNIKMSSINPGLKLSDFYPIATSGGQLYFSAYDKTIGYELYKTDGSSMSLVKDLQTANNADNNQSFNLTTKVGTELYFTLDNGHNGLEVWKSSGDSASTKLAFDLNKYPTRENNSNYTTSYDYYNTSTEISRLYSDGTLLYIAESNYLWVYDGVSPPSKIFTTGNAFNYQTQFAALNGLTYFNNSNKIYKTNGTLAGTAMVTSTDPSVPNDFRPITSISSFNNKIYFKGYHTVYGDEIFYTDGTIGNITLLTDLITGNNAFSYLDANFCKVGNSLYFILYHPTDGCTLYKTKGFEVNTLGLKSFGLGQPCPSFLTNYKDLILAFQGYDDINGYELWKSDGTTNGTIMIKDINASGSSYPANVSNGNKFAYYKDNLYFNASNGTTNYLYKTNMTSNGTFKLVKSINYNGLETEHGVYFNHSELDIGNEPHKIEADSASMRLVSNIVLGAAGSSSSNFVQNGDYLFTKTVNNITKNELHVFKICPNEYLLNTDQLITKKYEALDLIKISSSLAPGINQQLFAGKNVELLPGFKTQENTIFSATIGGCKTNIYGN